MDGSEKCTKSTVGLSLTVLEEQFNRINQALERMGHCDPDEFDEEEYDRLTDEACEVANCIKKLWGEESQKRFLAEKKQ